MSNAGGEEFPDFPVLPPHYKLCSNQGIKMLFFVGTVLQLLSVGLIISMLTVGPWMKLDVKSFPDPSNAYKLPRYFGLLQDCFYDAHPTMFQPVSTTNCYFKNFGQYQGTSTSRWQIDMTLTAAILTAIGLLFSACTVLFAIHLMIMWFRAPYDSFFMRNYRFCVGLSSMGTAIIILIGIIFFHMGLLTEVIAMPQSSRIRTNLAPAYGYTVAWVAEGVSVLSAWFLLSSTGCWAVDYVNCSSVAAAFNASCSQRNCVTHAPNTVGIRNSAFSVNSDGKWSIQDAPTLPRFHTNTYGDGYELRRITSAVES